MDMREQAAVVAEALKGTAKSLYDEASEAQMHDRAFCDALDEHVFECAQCGWWCGVEEQNDTDEGPKCDDCNGE